MVRSKHPIQLRIIGDVYGEEKKWLDSYVNTHRMEGEVVRTGWLDYRQVGPVISECHIGLIGYDRRPNHVVAAPNKLFNYMLLRNTGYSTKSLQRYLKNT